MKHKDKESEPEKRIGTAVPIQKLSSSDSTPSLSGFVERLKTVIGDETLRSFGKRCGLSAGALHHYINIGSEPSLSRLVAIAKAADVNLLWLATGEGPMRPDQVNEHGAMYATGRTLNLDLLTEAIDLVDAEAPQKSAAWKARMAVAIYDLGEETPRDKKAAIVRAAL